MTTLTLDHRQIPGAGPIDALYRREPLFTAAALLFALAMVPTGLAAVLDGRTLADVGVWTKPLKFEAAIVVYLISLAFFAAWLPAGTRSARWYRIYSVAVVAGLAAEMAWIAFAASRGVASHFNDTGLAWTTAYRVAGATAVMFTLAAPVFGWRIARNPATGLSPAVKAGIVDGLVLTGVMTIVTAGTLGASGGHLVGGDLSDAAGAPLFGWARDGGDLRVAHFFATHAMHAVPLAGLAAARLFGGGRTAPVHLAALAYAGLVAFTFAQALASAPFLPMLR